MGQSIKRFQYSIDDIFAQEAQHSESYRELNAKSQNLAHRAQLQKLIP
jgi:hypothetical protein